MWPPYTGAVLQYLVVLLVGCHGLAYLIFASQSRRVFEGSTGQPLLLGTTLSGNRLEALAVILWAVAGIGLMAAAIAFGPWFPISNLWRPIAVGASLVSIASFAVVWNGRAGSLVAEGGIGMIISAIILAGVVGLS